MDRALRDRRAGFTMIELLVAVAISTVVVAGLYGLFTVQSRQFLSQDLRASMHQNLRFGLDILTRTGGMAGYGTGGFTVGVFGWDSGVANDQQGMPAIITHNAWNGTHDAVTMVYADPSLEMMSSALTLEDCTTDEITFRLAMMNYSNLITNYSEGDLLICWDYANMSGTRTPSWMWSVTGVTGGVIGVENNASLYADYTNDATAGCEIGDNLPPIMSCSKGHVVTFYIDDVEDSIGPGTEDHPVLMMDLDMDWPETDDVPLVDDIEDMQIAYCLDDLDCSIEGNWLLNGSGTGSGTGGNLSNAEAQDVAMIRFTLVARSSRLDPRYAMSSTPVTAEDHIPTGTEDLYYRKALTTMVFAENLGSDL